MQPNTDINQAVTNEEVLYSSPFPLLHHDKCPVEHFAKIAADNYKLQHTYNQQEWDAFELLINAAKLELNVCSLDGAQKEYLETLPTSEPIEKDHQNQSDTNCFPKRKNAGISPEQLAKRKENAKKHYQKNKGRRFELTIVSEKRRLQMKEYQRERRTNPEIRLAHNERERARLRKKREAQASVAKAA